MKFLFTKLIVRIMNFLRMSLMLFFFMAGMALSANAQSLELFNFGKYKPDYHNTEFTAIAFNGKFLVEKDTPDGPLNIDPTMKGKLSIATEQAACNSSSAPGNAVGFKLGVKDFRTNTIWLFSEETLYEVDLEQIMKQCEMGDSLIFMLTDKKYRLSRHELVLVDGC
jgi:hypothetical protein